MDTSVALWILLPLAALHLALRRDRSAFAFQLVVDVALLVLPLRPLATGAHLGPAVRVGPADARTVAGSPEQTDLPLQFSVWWEEVRRLGATGEPPWVSDRIGGGVPLYAHGQTGLPFPLHLPVWALGAERGTDVMAVWKLELAALGCFFLLRRLGARAAAAAAGAIAYGFGLHMLAWLVVPLSWVAAATPWAWLLLLASLRGDRRAAALLALLCGALAGWSVHPESAGFLLLALGLTTVILGWGSRRRLLRGLAPLLLAAAVAGVGAVPVLFAIADSPKLAAARAVPQYPLAWLSGELRARVAALLVVPWREGHPADASWRWPFASAAVTVGIGAAPLALLLAAPLRRRHRRLGLALAVTGALAAVLLWQLPGAAHVLTRVPVLGVMVWGRAAFLLPFALAMLAALAADSWLRRPRRRRLVAVALAVQAAVAVLIVTAPATAPRRDLWPSALAPGALAALVPLLPATGGWPLPGLVLAESVLAGGRLLPVSSGAPGRPRLVAELQRLVAAEGGRILGLDSALPPNLAARAGLADLRANDPVRPRALAALHGAFGSEWPDLPGPITRPWAGLSGAWGVRWLVTPASGLGSSGEAAVGWEETWRGADGRIYRNRRTLPVLRLATAAVAPPGAAAAGAWEPLDFATTAVVDEPLRLDGSGEIAALESRPWRTTARVVARGAVLAVLHVPRAHGWRAMLDGRPAPLVTADLAAMAVMVPNGEHEVRWEYAPSGLAAGAALTAAALAGCAVLARGRRRWR